MINITAGSEFGFSEARYEVQSKRLVLMGLLYQNLGLVNNKEVLDFAGLTTEEAKVKAQKLENESGCLEWDGCHDCKWRIYIEEEELPKERKTNNQAV